MDASSWANWLKRQCSKGILKGGPQRPFSKPILEEELELSDGWSSTFNGQAYARSGIFRGNPSTGMVVRHGWEGWRAQLGYYLSKGDPEFVQDGDNWRQEELCLPGEYLAFGQACRRVDDQLVNKRDLEVCREVTES